MKEELKPTDVSSIVRFSGQHVHQANCKTGFGLSSILFRQQCFASLPAQTVRKSYSRNMVFLSLSAMRIHILLCKSVSSYTAGENSQLSCTSGRQHRSQEPDNKPSLGLNMATDHYQRSAVHDFSSSPNRVASFHHSDTYAIIHRSATQSSELQHFNTNHQDSSRTD